MRLLTKTALVSLASLALSPLARADVVCDLNTQAHGRFTGRLSDATKTFTMALSGMIAAPSDTLTCESYTTVPGVHCWSAAYDLDLWDVTDDEGKLIADLYYKTVAGTYHIVRGWCDET